MSAKQKLTFKVEGRTLTYEGYPENRVKDLMQALLRLKVEEGRVVPAFRDNVPEESGMADAEVMKRYAEAKQRDAEKQAARMGTSNASPRPEAAAGTGVAADGADEAPQKITLYFKGRGFSYTGLLSSKPRAVIELLTKQQGVTRDLAVATYHENLADTTLTDDEIWAQVEEAMEARRLRKLGTSTQADAQPAAATAASSSSTPPHPATPLGIDPAVASASTAKSSGNGINAINELGEYTQEERESINRFISQVISDPSPEGGTMYTSRSVATARSLDQDGVLMTVRSIAGKDRVDCYEEGTNVTKVILVSPDMTFADFYGVVEKKFGRKMALSFYEGSDEIEVDDDDVLEMFLKMPLVDGRRRLICSNPEKRLKHTDDKLTEATATTAGATVAPKAFSNGKLEVKEERTFTGHSLAVYCCAFSSKGDAFCTASRDRSVRVWNTKTGSNTVMRGGHNGFVLSCDFSPKGDRIVSSSDDRTIKIWNVNNSSKVSTLKGHEDKVYCVQYNKSGDYIVSGSVDTTVRVWNASTGQKQAVMRGHTLAVFSCSFSNTDNGKYVVSGSDDRLIKVWDWAASKEVRTLMGHTGTVWSCCFAHNDNHIVSTSMDQELRLWDTVSGSCIRTMNGHQTPIHHAIFSANDKYILSCARDWTVMVWDRETGEHMETIQGHNSTVYHMAIFNDKLLTCSLDDTLKLFTIREK